MITNAFLQFINGREYVVQAEVEETKLGYKLTLPDGRSAEIRRDMVRNIELERENSGHIGIAGDCERITMVQNAPHYNEIESERLEQFR